METRGVVSGGIVKYKLTPNLDLAKLASIRQFPKLNYKTKSMHCGKGKNLRIGQGSIFNVSKILDSQLLTFGDSQFSIFDYDSGDLLMSLDLMKNYGTNLSTFSFKEVCCEICLKLYLSTNSLLLELLVPGLLG